MSHRQDLARLLLATRTAAIQLLEKVEAESARRGLPEVREESDMYDRTVIAFALVGLMDRAQFRGVPWADIQADAEDMMREFAEHGLTLQVH